MRNIDRGNADIGRGCPDGAKEDPRSKKKPVEMFKLVRFFAVACAVALIGVTAILYGLYRQMALDEIVRTTEQHNATLARAIANAVSPLYEDRSWRGGTRASDRMPGEELATQVDSGVRLLVRGLPVVKVVIYDRDENIVYSSSQDEMGAAGADDAQGFRVALGGKSTAMSSSGHTCRGLSSRSGTCKSLKPICRSIRNRERCLEYSNSTAM